MSTLPPTTPPERNAADRLVGLYAQAEAQLLALLTAVVAHTLPTAEAWAASLPKLRRIVRRIARLLEEGQGDLIRAMVDGEAVQGLRDGVLETRTELERSTNGAGSGRPPLTPGNDVESTDEPFDFGMTHAERAAKAIRDDITSQLLDVRHRVTRLPDDIYKMIAPHGAIYQALDNNVTPQHAQAMAWRVFISQGITGFTDVSGRDWSLSAYTEMAVRTAAARAYNASHLERMQALGIHYFTVGFHNTSCPFCFPWQGAVLTAVRIEDPEIPVDATIAEAVAAKLFHPNCRHTLLPVIPGVTVLPPRGEWTDEMDARYKATQKQRRLEVEERKAKRELEYAVDQQVRREAAADVAELQRKIREHLAEHDLPRQSRREQVNMGMGHHDIPEVRADTTSGMPPTFFDHTFTVDDDHPRLSYDEIEAQGLIDPTNSSWRNSERDVASWLAVNHGLRTYAVRVNNDDKMPDAVFPDFRTTVEFKRSLTGSITSMVDAFRRGLKQSSRVIVDVRGASGAVEIQMAIRVLEQVSRRYPYFDGLLIIGQGWSVGLP